MQLSDWLAETGLTYKDVAHLISGSVGRKIAPNTIRAIATVGSCRVDIARALIALTHGAVGLDDLVRNAPTPRKAERR